MLIYKSTDFIISLRTSADFFNALISSLSREIGSSDKQVRDWVKIYLSEGEAGLEQKKKPGNPLSRYERRKELTYEEQLQYQIELLKRELVKKEAEVLRLKKLNDRKGGDARKR